MEKKEKGTRFGRKEDKSNGGSRRCELCARGRSIRARNTPLFEGRPGNEGIAEVRSAGGCAGKLLVDVGERRLGDLLSRLEGWKMTGVEGREERSLSHRRRPLLVDDPIARIEREVVFYQ